MAEAEGTQPDDVDMLNTSEASAEPSDAEANYIRLRGRSVDMLRTEVGEEVTSPSQDRNMTILPSTEDNIPPIDEQIAKVEELVAKQRHVPIKEGDKVYLVSKKWLSKVTSRASDVKGSKEIEEAVGPVDNSDIILEVLKDADGADFARLRAGVGEESFQYLPHEAWNLVVSWYGIAAGSAAIERIAHNTNQDVFGIEQYQYELYPPVIQLHRVWSAISPVPLPQMMKASQPEAPVLACSQSEKWLSFLLRAKKELQIERETKVRIWRIPKIMPTAAASFQDDKAQPEVAGVWSKLLVDAPTFTQLEKGVQREELPEAEAGDVSANPKYNGTRTLAMAGLLSDEILVFEEQVKDGPTANGIWLTTYIAQDAPPSSALAHSVAVSKKVSSPPATGPITRGRANRNGKTVGVIGLSNMGNTCYMNSALQCVRSVEELSKYFLSNEALNELNPDNPLGNNGEVAIAYSKLLHEIYKKDTTLGSVRPGHFKNTIGKYAPSFSGYGQQDSQEFLGFLLDGLQEDLSRVKKKPYIEKPDSTDEMVTNPELIRKMAAQVWDITKKRDDSVIADLFTGMYKSTLVCPVCSKVSITFDPFNNLTLQLPIGDPWTHTVVFFPLNDRPVEVQVDLDKHATIKALKEFVGKRVDLPADRLVVIDQWNQKCYKIYDELETVAEAITSNDKTHIYELDGVPTNWPVVARPSKKKKKQTYGYNSVENDPLPHWDDPMADRLLVPVLHRRANPVKGRFVNKPWLTCLTPQFITLTRSEARDSENIKRKILQQAANLTDYKLLHDEDEDENASSDIVITTGSDADSSGEGKVTAKSVDGEDDVVDVTMKDSGDSMEQDKPSSREQDGPFPIRKFRTRVPKFLDLSTHLEPELQNMFDMCYFSENNDIVPTGWGTTPEDKELPKLLDRDVRLQAEMRRAEDHNRYRLNTGGRSLSGDSSSTASDDDAPDIGVTCMADESSEEDAEPKVVRPRTHRVGLGKAELKTFRQKGLRLMNKKSRLASEDSDEAEGPLVRIGEGICIDWSNDAFEGLFGGSPSDTFRAACTLNQIDKLEDPALEAKLKARALRKRNGVTLEECLDEFQREEILSEVDTWYCPRCKEHQRASKKFQLWKSPDILIIHLKRFSSSTNRREKLDIPVAFPIENLDISSRVVETEPGKQEVYDLFAIDDHWGGLGGGHYTAYAKSFYDNQWYEYNDSCTSKVHDLSKMISPAAYLLFYRRRSDVPLGGPRLREIVARYDNPIDEPSSLNDSGEDQRLDAISSQAGSSSALTGAEVVHRRVGSLNVDHHAMNQDPPAYPGALEDDDNAGVEYGPHDEGIGMEESKPVFTGMWNFSAITNPNPSPRNSSNASDRSDAVAHGSDPGDEDMAERLNQFNSADTDDEYMSEKEVPPPDVEMDDQADKAFSLDVLQGKLHVVEEIEPRDEDESEDKVDEIHV